MKHGQYDACAAHILCHYSDCLYNGMQARRVMAAAGFPEDEALVEEMALQNPWWAGGRVPDARLSEFKRHDYSVMAQRIEGHRVHALLGARQVGKTTLLYQLAAELVGRNDPRRVMLLPLDEPGLFASAENLHRMLGLYGLRVLGESLHHLTKKTYVMLDEIQEVKNWQRVVKAVVDRRGPITFIVSGSSSADIFGSSESLVGRIRHQTMQAMSFSEYLYFKDRSRAGELRRIGSRMRDALAESVKGGDPLPFHACAKDALLELASAKSDLLIRLEEYLLYGGYPGIAAATGADSKAAELRTHLRLSMYNDVVKVGSVRSPRAVEQLFYMLAQDSPRLLSKERTMKTLGINRRTLDAYLYLLEAAYMVSYADAYVQSASARGRSAKKVYINDAGARSAALSMSGARVLASPEEAGRMAENVAGGHTSRLRSLLCPAAAPAMPPYWRSGSGSGDEVDLVLDTPGGPVPIEVKYRRQVDASDLRGLSRFADLFGSGVALAITRDQLGLVADGRGSGSRRAVAVPLWLYLLMC